MINILCALLVVSVHGCVATGSDRTSPVYISALLRQHAPAGGPDDTCGNLIKVLPAANSSQVRNISAVGRIFTNSTKFYVEKSNAKKAKAIRYTEGKIDYYMCVENAGKVLLRKSNVFPSQNKYFFQIGDVSLTHYYYRYFKSMDTGEYLHVDRTGKLFFGVVPSSSFRNGKPHYRRTWFLFVSALL